MDWNIILDEKGGPNNAIGGEGFTDAPIILNKDFTEMYKGPMFYVMAHFSKFIIPGSVRIEATLSGISSKFVQTIAFLRPDDKVTVILYNNCSNVVDMTIKCAPKRAFSIKLKPKSINSLVYSEENDDEVYDDYVPSNSDSSQSTNIFLIRSLWQ